jgi:hypothetical protein
MRKKMFMNLKGLILNEPLIFFAIFFIQVQIVTADIHISRI